MELAKLDGITGGEVIKKRLQCSALETTDTFYKIILRRSMSCFVSR